MKYKVIKGADTQLNDALNATVEQVNAAMAEGWLPVGGVNISSVGTFESLLMYIVCQAMTKA